MNALAYCWLQRRDHAYEALAFKRHERDADGSEINQPFSLDRSGA
jgi:hypothetical protein